ncbi:MAG: heparan-alpha-glucosaminide N-acetyltransferase domain-containing protein [Actinomycetaceae bacterium]
MSSTAPARPPTTAAHPLPAGPSVPGGPGAPGAPGSPAPGMSAPEAPAPRSAGRILGLDLARGIAVLGMVTAHVGFTTEDLSTLSGWLGFAHGRSSILFCLLAGVSLGILTGGRTPYSGVPALQARTRVLVRAALLLAVTAALAMLDTFVALILGFYAVWFMFSLPFHRWRARRLLVVGGIWLLVSSVAMPYLLTLLEASGLVADAWGVNGAVLDAMLGLYPGFVWFGLILVGMGIARLDLRSWKVLLILLGAGILSAGVGYGGGWALREANVGTIAFSGESEDDPYPGEQSSAQFLWTGDQPPAVVDGSGTAGGSDVDAGGTGEPWHAPGIPGLTFDTDVVWPGTTDLLQSSAHSASPVEMVGSGGVALAILAACLLLPRVVQTALLPVRAIGTMSLTAYSAHVVVIDWWPDTFAVFEESNRPLAYLAGGLAVGCLAWYLLLGRGPLERLMHMVSMRAARTDAGTSAAPAPTPSQRVDPPAPYDPRARAAAPGPIGAPSPWSTPAAAPSSTHGSTPSPTHGGTPAPSPTHGSTPAPAPSPERTPPDTRDTSRFAPPPVHLQDAEPT